MGSEREGSIGWKLWVQWVLANVISIGIGLRIADLAEKLPTRNFLQDYLFPLVGFLLFACLVGIGQWIVLRQYGISMWWIPATAIGALFFSGYNLLIASIPQSFILWSRVRWSGLWILTAFVFFLIDLREVLFEFLPYFWLFTTSRSYMVITVSTAINAMLSGLILVWLLRHPKFNKSVDE